MTRESKIVLGALGAVLVVVICLPSLTMGVLFTAGAITAVGMRGAVQSTVRTDRSREVFRELAALERGIQREVDLGRPLEACHDEATARSLLRPETKYAVPADDCLVKLGLSPDPLYGRYWVEVDAAGAWRAGGVIDADADLVPAEAELVAGGQPRWVTEDTY